MHKRNGERKECEEKEKKKKEKDMFCESYEPLKTLC